MSSENSDDRKFREALLKKNNKSSTEEKDDKASKFDSAKRVSRLPHLAENNKSYKMQASDLFAFYSQ